MFFEVTSQPLVLSPERVEFPHRVFLLLVFVFTRFAVAHEVVQRAVLDQRRKHKDKAHGHEEVHGRHIRHFGQRLPGDGAERRHGEHRGDSCTERSSEFE